MYDQSNLKNCNCLISILFYTYCKLTGIILYKLADHYIYLEYFISVIIIRIIYFIICIADNLTDIENDADVTISTTACQPIDENWSTS